MTDSLKFSGGGGSSGDSQQPVRTPNNLFADDTIEVLIGVSEGPCGGLTKGPQEFFLDDTPLLNSDGELNYEGFTLDFFPGQPLGEEVNFKLGGISSSNNVGVELEQNTTVTRQGGQVNIDYIDVRLAVGLLYKQNENGTYEDTLKLKVEYKAQSESNWTNAYVQSLNGNSAYNSQGDPLGNPNGVDWGDFWRVQGNYVPGNPSTFTALGSGSSSSTFKGDRVQVFVEPTTPVTSPFNSIWLDSDNNFKPRISNGTVFEADGVEASDKWTLSDGTVIWKPRTSAPASPNQGDIYLNTLNEVSIYNGSSWGEPNTSSTSRSYQGDGIINIRGKTTDVTPKEIRFPVPRINEPYQVRVTKLSNDNITGGTEEKYSVVRWESFQEIIADSFTAPNTTMVKVAGRASNQFSSVPNFSGIYEGKILKVPTNYDPEARTYTGVWNGTFKMAYTNNPAWILADFVENDRYGLSSLYPHTIDKFAFYEWAQWCDTMVSDGEGGQRPRWTFNDYVQNRRPAKEMANYIAGAAGARFIDDGSGKVTILIDKYEDPVALFTPENVIDGEFDYSYSDVQTRANDITVSYINPDLKWNEDKRRVFDQDNIDSVGRIPLDFLAVGCTNTSEAIARARHKLVTNLTETSFVNFKTNRKGMYLKPYEIVLVADPAMGFGMTGRIRSFTPTTVTLRDPVTLQPNTTYTFVFDKVSNGSFTTVEKQITTSAGEHSVLTLQGGTDGVTDQIQFTIKSEDDFGVPKPFRVVAIEKPEDNIDIVSVTAMEVNPTKQTFVDGGSDNLPEHNYTNLETGQVNPVTNLNTKVFQHKVGNLEKRVVELTWTKSSTKWVRQYRVYHSLDGSPFTPVGSTSYPRFEMLDVGSGTHVFKVVAININNVESTAVTTQHVVEGSTRSVSPVENLRLTNGTDSTTFDVKAPEFTWEKGSKDPNHSHYKVEIVSSDNSSILRTQQVLEPRYVYEYNDNVLDAAGRSFRVKVHNVDQYGNVSEAEEILVNNPAPTTPTNVEVVTRGGVTILSYTPQNIRDLEGTLIWLSDTSNVDTSNTPTYDTKNNSVSFEIPINQTRYAKLASYDTFGKDNLNVSNEMVITMGKISGTDIESGTISQSAIDLGFQTTINQMQQDITNANTTAQTNLNLAQTNLQQSIDSLDQELTTAEGNITNALSRLDTVEPTVASQGNSITNLQSVNAAQASQITALQADAEINPDGAALNQDPFCDYDPSRTWDYNGQTVTHSVGGSDLGNHLGVVGSGQISTSKFIPVNTARKYRLSVVIRQKGVSLTNYGRVYVGVVCHDKNKAHLSGGGGFGTYCTLANQSITHSGFQSYEGTITGEDPASSASDQFRLNTAFVKLIIYPATSGADAGAGLDVASIVFEDVTDAENLSASILAEETARVAEDSAQALRLTGLEASVNTPNTGLLAKSISQETAITNLQTNKAEVSSLDALTARVNQGSNSILYPLNDTTDTHFVESYGYPEASYATQTGPIAVGNVTLENNSDHGKVLQATSYRIISERASHPIVSGKQYRLKFRTRLTQDPAPSAGQHSQWCWLGFTDSTGAFVGYASVGQKYGLTVADGWVTRDMTFNPQYVSDQSSSTENAVNWRLMFGINGYDSDTGGAIQQVAWISIEEVSEVESVKADLITEQTARTSADAAQVGRLDLLEASVDGSTGLLARVTSAETTIADHTANKADASVVNALSVQLEAAPSGGVLNQDPECNYSNPSEIFSSPVGNVTASRVLDGGNYIMRLTGEGRVQSLKRIPVDTSRKYKLSCRVRQNVSDGSGSDYTYIGLRCLDAEGNFISRPAYGSYNYMTVVAEVFSVGGWHERAGFIQGEDAATPTSYDKFSQGTAFVEIIILPNYYQGSTGEFDVDYIRLEDVTDAENLAADILTEQTARVSADAAQVGRLDQLEATVDGSTGLAARLITAENAIADNTANKAEVSALQTLQAETDTLEGSVSNLQTAVVAEQTARLTDVTELRAQLYRYSDGKLTRNSRLAPPRDTAHLGYYTPVDWLVWASGTLVQSIVEDGVHEKAQIGTGTGTAGLYQEISGINPGDRLKVKLRAELVSGGWERGGVRFEYRNSLNNVISSEDVIDFALTKDIKGELVSASGGVKTVVAVSGEVPANTTHVRVILGVSQWQFSGTLSNKVINFYELSVDAVPEEEAFSGTIKEVVLGDGSSPHAFWQAAAGIGGATSTIRAGAKIIGGAPVSSVGISADVIGLYNGTTDEAALKVVGGDVEMSGNLTVGSSIRVGNAKWPVALSPVQFTASDGETVSYGGDLGTIPIIEFNDSALPSLASGQTRTTKAINSTGSGFTLSSKVSTPGTVSSVVNTSDTSGSGSFPDRLMHKTDSADAYDGNYTFTCSGTLYITSSYESELNAYFNNGSIVIDLIVNSGSGFVVAGKMFVNPQDAGVPVASSSPQTGTYSWTKTAVVNFGSPIGSHGNFEFAADLYSSTPGSSLNDLNSVSYNKRSDSGVSTATPNGEKVLITITPRNT